MAGIKSRSVHADSTTTVSTVIVVTVAALLLASYLVLNLGTRSHSSQFVL